MKYSFKVSLIAILIFASFGSIAKAQEFDSGVLEKTKSNPSQTQNASSSDQATPVVRASAMTTSDNRGMIETFIFGPDQKNLEAVRDELAITNSNLAQLKSLLSMTMEDAGIVGLNAQINDLELEKILLEEYITTNENTFSIFGWFKKLFTK